MNNLTQQMLDEYKPYLKKSHWDDFVKYRLQDVKKHGNIVSIEDVFDYGTNKILERKYAYASGLSLTLDAIRAGCAEEGLPFAPIVQ